MEIFQTFAEVSIGILGFTAIVIMFRNPNSKWNNNIYQGMIGHCMMALICSFLPFLLDAYHCKPATIWTTGSIFLGSITGLQGILVLFTDKDSSQLSRIFMFIFSLFIAILQFLNVFGILSDQDKGPYVIGIAWHIIQSLIIFSMIVGRKLENGAEPKA